MALMKSLILLCVSAAMGDNASVPLVTFDGSASTHFDFTASGPAYHGPDQVPNSKATWDVKDGHGILDGEVIVEWNDGDLDSGLADGWPGFVRSTANGDFPDASSVSDGALVLMVRSSTPEYNGFHVSLGTTEKWSTAGEACGPTLGPFKNRGCYKAPFSVPAGDDFAPVRIPFSSFQGAWLFGNGNVPDKGPKQWPFGSQKKYSCPDNKDNCLTSKTLARIKSMDLWAEGVAGKVHLEVKSITASASSNSFADAFFLV